ncbi:MAG: helix-hairpin-helix domain-containing protein [Planctomycetota bacterium]
MAATPIQDEASALRRVAWWGLLMLLCGMAVMRWATRPDPGLGSARLETGYRVDVNQADPATLQLLPGIGPSIARNVVEWRETHGPFTTPAQLEQVRMIGPVVRDRLTPWITLGPPPSSEPIHPKAEP